MATARKVISTRSIATSIAAAAIVFVASPAMANAGTYHGPFRFEAQCMFASGEYKPAAPYLERRCERHDDGQWWFVTK